MGVYGWFHLHRLRDVESTHALPVCRPRKLCFRSLALLAPVRCVWDVARAYWSISLTTVTVVFSICTHARTLPASVVFVLPGVFFLRVAPADTEKCVPSQLSCLELCSLCLYLYVCAQTLPNSGLGVHNHWRYTDPCELDDSYSTTGWRSVT